MGLATKLGDARERGPVRGRREHRASGEVDADADDVRPVHSGLREGGRDRALERRDVVVGILEGPVGPEADVVIGCREVGVDDAVGVWEDGAGELPTGRHVDKQRSTQFRPEIDPDGGSHGAHSMTHAIECIHSIGRSRGAIVRTLVCAAG